MSLRPPAIPLPSSRKNLLRTFSLVFFALLTIPLLILGSLHWRLSSRIKSRLNAIRAAHEPVTLTDLNGIYGGVSPDSNAAAYYERAFAVLHKNKAKEKLDGIKRLPANSEPLPAKMRATMNEVVAENLAAFELLDEAVKFESCRYPVDYTRGWKTLLPHLAQIRTCSKLQLCQGVLKEQHDDVSGAINSIRLILNYSASLDSEPDLISLLTQHHLHSDATELLRWLLDRRQLTQPQLAALAQMFPTREPVSRLEYALFGERCSTVATFNYSSGEILDVIDPGYKERFWAVLGFYLLQLTGKMKQDQISFLDRMAECHDALRLPLPQRLGRAQEIRQTIEREAYSRKLLFTAMIVPSFLRGFTREAQAVAEQHLVHTALAIEKFRLANGALPLSLSDLGPDRSSQNMMDTFDGKPLRYRKEEFGYVLYSVGPDGSDDGGSKPITVDAKWESPKGDVIFSVHR